MAGTPLRYSGLGMNYGVVPAFLSTQPLAIAQATLDLNDMWKDGYRSLRMWLYNPTTSPSQAITNIFAIADLAKSMGFYVVFGVTSLGQTLSDANWTTISNGVIAAATSAQTHGYDEFVIDNEANGRISGLSNFFTKYAALATSVKGVFSGIVSYNESENNIGNWVGQTVGVGGTVPVDQFGMNTYGGGNTEAGFRFSLLNLQICWNQFGNKSYISETNIYSANPYVGLTSKQIFELSEWKVRKAFAVGFTRVFFFSWTSPSDQFSVKNADGTFRRNRYAFTNRRRVATEIVV